ncbi:MAG: molybdopterin-guanine dinucleotide biosynthesis protein MobB [Pedobacter sp.]|nr:MAG: molybdopterin-guanine dinucleotide biosynthesis protein MobB [Pedobacter sp.]
MYTNITDSETGNNQGSSCQLVHYLDKENRVFPEMEKQMWFNGSEDDIESYKVRTALDGNIRRLCKGDSKFFLVNISPSQKEIGFLVSEYGEDEAKECLKDYAVRMMDEYARNFKRPGIESNENLLWFGKLEHFRYYGFRDAEVKSGQVKAGSLKPGSNWHLQLIVSRKDITNSVKLSPMNKSRGKNAEHSLKLGQFDRTTFKMTGEKVFDEMFGFERGLQESFEYANVQKNGNIEQKLYLQKNIGHTVEPSKFDIDLKLDNLLEDMLKEEYQEGLGDIFRKKRKRGHENDQGLSL